VEESKFIDKDNMLECINLLFTGFWRILDFLKTNKNEIEPIYSIHIQEEFHINKSTVSHYLVPLESLGLIKRKRGVPQAISITELGESFVP